MSQLAILCIDDEQMVLDSLAMELEPKFPGLEVALLDQQDEAEDLVDELSDSNIEVAAIVCDYIMPGRRGDEVLASLHRKIPDARTIMLTGQSSLDGVTNAINRANLFRYIAKPWGSEDLKLTLEAAIDSFRQQRQIERANQELRELNENLERKVEERTRDLTEAHEKIREYVDIIDDNVLISRIDRDGRIISVSKAFCDRYGHEPEDVVGKDYWRTLYSHISDEDMQRIQNCLKQGQTWQGELEHVSSDGNRYWAHEIISPNTNEGAVVVGFTSILQDITDRKAIERMSITDSLTGLFNRRHFDTSLARRIKQGRQTDEYLALGMIDIDHFKLFNDNYGHAAGDEVLRKLGECLRDNFKRSGDMSFRIGGEEFAVLMSVVSTADARSSAEFLQCAINELHIPHGHSPTADHVTISLGVGLIHPGQATNSSSPYQFCDGLLYEAKRAGRNRMELQLMPSGK